jgi:integrase
MGKIGFRIRSTREGQVPVYVYIYWPYAGREEVKTGLFVKVLNWDTDTQRSSGTGLSDLELNESLNRLEQHLLRVINSSSSVMGEGSMSLEKHVNTCFYRVKRDKQETLLYHIESYIESAAYRRVKRTGSIGLSQNSIRNLMRFYEVIGEFEAYRNAAIYLNAIDHGLVHSFQEWLLSVKQYSINSAGLQLKLLKMVCKDAERKGVNVHSYTRHIESFTQRSKDRILQTLSFDEIHRIKALHGLPSTIENTRRWMLIGLFIGQRVSDLLSLKPSQVRQAEVGVYVDLLQQKTDKHVTVGIVDKEVINILANYFPYTITQQQFNKQLKTICQLAGITQMVKGYKICEVSKRRKLGVFPKYSIISSHDLRRSFATNYFGKIPTPILMQITGHSKESTFLSYIGAQVNKDAYADAFMKMAATF